MDQINIVSGETKVFEWNDQVNRNFLESFMNGYIAVKLKNPNWNLYGIILSSDQGRTYNTTEGSVYIAADNGNMLGFTGVVKGSWIVREGGVWVNKGIQTISTIEVLFNGINIGGGVEIFANALENLAKFRTLVAGQNITISQNEETITISTTEASGEANTGQNVGDTGIGIFKQKSGVTLQFKKIEAGTGLSISEAGDVITISNISPEAGETNTGQSLGTGIPVYVGKSGVVLQFNSLKFGGSISGSLSNNEITISSTAELNTIANLGVGADIYKEKVGTEFKLRSIRGDSSIVVTQLDDTIDLSFSGLTDLSVLSPGAGITGNSYNGTSDQTWNINFAGNGFASTVARSDHNHTLDSLSNSAMTSKSVNDIVGWNGSNWTNLPYPSGEIVSGVNLGSGQYPVFVEKSGTELRYRRLKPGTGISMSISDTNYVEISASGFEPSITAGISPQFFSWDKTWKQVDYSQLSGLPDLVTSFGDLSDVPEYTSSDALKFVRVNSTNTALEYATIDLSSYQPLIAEGSSPQYYSWNKTFKQIDYSEIANTPDITNFVTKDGVETITGLKTFKNDGGVLIKNSVGSVKALKIGVTSSTSEYVGELRYDAIGGNRVWLLPDGSGILALADDLLLQSVTLNFQTYLAPKTTTHRLSIGNSSYNLGDEVLLLKAMVAYGGSAALSFFEKDYSYHLLRLNHDGTLNTGRGLKLGGYGTVSRRVTSLPYIQFSYPSANDRSVSITLLEEPAANVNFYLPTSDGSNGQVLTTNGAGQWSWSTVSGGGSYTVFTNTVNGLVPAPNISDGTTKVLSHNGTTHSWTTLSTGVTTRLRLNSGTYRSGDLTLQTVESNPVVITESSSGVFQIVHSDTSSVSSVETSGFNVVKNLTIDGFGHVTDITTRSLLPTTSNGYFLRDDGVWVSVTGGGGGTVTSISAGSGMNFSTITTSGAIVLGTPSSITATSINNTSSGTHTHALSFASNRLLATSSTGSLLEIPFGGVNTILSSNGTQVGWINFLFTGLGDTPMNYTGSAGKLLSVNASETALEFISLPEGIEHNPTSLIGSVSFLQLNSTTQELTVSKIEISDIDASGTASSSTFLRGDGVWAAATSDGSYSFTHSLYESSGTVMLVNDSATPGNSKYYGTNNIGTRGWFNLPSGTIAQETDPFFTQWINTSNIIPIFSAGELSLQIYDQGILKYTTTTVNLDNRYYTETEISQFYSGATVIAGYNKTNWDTAYGWGNHINLYAPLSRSITINGTTQTLAADRTWNVGTITSVGVGGGIVLGGTLTDPTLSIQSLSGVASSIGTINVSGNKIGVDLGTTSTTAAAGNHTHVQLHDKLHSITSTTDHTANNWKIFYSNGLGQVTELALSTDKRLLISRGVDRIPEFVDLSSLDVFGVGVKGLVPAVDNDSETEEMRFLRADGLWRVPAGGGTGMSNPMTAIGDMIYRSADSNPAALTIGSLDQVLSVKNISGKLVPVWTTLSSTFVLSVTGDVNISSAQNDALLQTQAINGKTPSLGLTDSDEFLINQSGLKKVTSLQIKQYINPLTSKGDLVVGNDSGSMSRFAANTTSTRRILSQTSSTTSWVNYDLPTIMNLSYGTANQLLKVNATRTALEYFTPSNLSPGNGILGSAYNGQSAQTWSLNFLASGGVNGTSNNPSRSDHSHDSFSKLPTVSTGKLLGRSTSLSAGEIQEITINTTASESSMKFIGTTVSAKLQNESSPTLGGPLNANSNNISLSGNIIPVVDGSTSLKDIGSSSAYWKDIYSKGKIYLAGGTTFYAGDINGSAYLNNISAGAVTARTYFILGSWKFELANSGNTMRLVHNNIIRFEFYSTGDMKFFVS